MVVLCSVPVFGSDTMTGIFDEKIKSLQVRLDGNDFANPFHRLYAVFGKILVSLAEMAVAEESSIGR